MAELILSTITWMARRPGQFRNHYIERVISIIDVLPAASLIDKRRVVL